MTATILRGDARSIPLADGSVDLIVTSPPYFALRSYQDGGVHYERQIGSEATPAEFVDALIDVTRECVRVLKPTGSLWVNLGDKYSQRVATRPSSHQDGLFPDREDLPKDWKRDKALGLTRMPYQNVINPETGNYVREKSLIGIPWRYALRCIDDLGLILRAEVIWSKPNGLPESVTDRVRRSHEQWFYFEPDSGDVVEAGSQGFPFCPLCGRPKDARATLVARLHEVESGVEDVRLSDQVRTHERVQGYDAASSDQERVVGSSGAPVPLPVVVDALGVEDASAFLNDGVVAVEDVDAQMRSAAIPSVAQGYTALAVDDSSQPSEVCSCSHPFILDDEPWIPQSLAAELMQMVADGEADAQNVADFLSGDYARTHSTWFHLVKSPRYFSAVDEIREPYSPNTDSFVAMKARWTENRIGTVGTQPHNGNPGLAAQSMNPLGKLPGSVWTVPTEPLIVPPELGVDHFAAFPSEFPRRIIQGWSPSGVCTACGEGRRPVAVQERTSLEALRPAYGAGNHGTGGSTLGPRGVVATITGYACACLDTTAPTTPAIVLDPFGGTGTVALVADVLGRHGISLDMSADYCRLAQWRTTDPGQRAKAARVEKPVKELDGQLGFELEGIA